MRSGGGIPRYEAPDQRRYVALRKTLALDAVPERMPARICAESRYVLWVNGVEIARGPVRVNPRRRTYDVVDLASHLGAGPNVLAVLGCFYARPNAWWMPVTYATNQVAAGGVVLEGRLDDEWFITDSSWKVLPVEGWTAGPPSGIGARADEIYDLRALPEHWTTAEFDDSHWRDAVELRAAGFGEAGHPAPPTYPTGPVRQRPIAWPAVDEHALTRADDGTFDAGEVVAGTIVLDVEGPAGAELRVATAEFPNEPGGGFSVTLDGSRRTIETFDPYGLRTLTVDAADGVSVHRVAARERLYPVVGDATFECSDDTLNQIWAVGRRTVSLCSFDAYLDCPTREQRAWTGDMVVHQMVDLTTNADWRLATWAVELAASPRADGMLPMAVAGDIEHGDWTVIPDWALHWVHALWNVHRYTGDRELVARLLPVAEGVVQWFEPFCDEEGCPVDVIGWVIIDWSAVPTGGVCAALCGLWGRALLELAEMAAWLGDAGREARARRLHERLAAGFERLWDPDRERYADVMTAGTRGATASQHGQAAAIVGGLAPRDRHARLVEVLTDEAALVHVAWSAPGTESVPGSDVPVGGAYLATGQAEPWWDVDRQVVRAQPFFRYVVHDALAAAGRVDLIAGQCREWSILLERCATSWSETWYGGTVSHGWCSTPTRDLMTRVLGLEPHEPGFAMARIEPALGGLEWARGRVPSPAGSIAVDARPSRLEVDSPIPFVHAGRRYDAGGHRIER